MESFKRARDRVLISPRFEIDAGKQMAKADDVFDMQIGLVMWDTQRRIDRVFAAATAAEGLAAGLTAFLRAVESNEGLTQAELARQVMMRGPTTTKAVDALERLNLIRRESSPTDGRKLHLFLTDKGKDLCRRLKPIAQMLNDRILRGFSKQDEERFRSYLKKIRDNLESP
jgi:MarR family transcriptional regulator, organic hydroperoxide resistance regulator